MSATVFATRLLQSMVGERGGKWASFKLYTVSREEAAAFIPKAARVLKSMWAAFAQSMGEGEP